MNIFKRSVYLLFLILNTLLIHIRRQLKIRGVKGVFNRKNGTYRHIESTIWWTNWRLNDLLSYIILYILIIVLMQKQKFLVFIGFSCYNTCTHRTTTLSSFIKICWGLGLNINHSPSVLTLILNTFKDWIMVFRLRFFLILLMTNKFSTVL